MSHLAFPEPPVGAVLSVFLLSCFVQHSKDTVSPYGMPAGLSRTLLQLLCFFVLKLDRFNWSLFHFRVKDQNNGAIILSLPSSSPPAHPSSPHSPSLPMWAFVQVCPQSVCGISTANTHTDLHKHTRTLTAGVQLVAHASGSPEGSGDLSPQQRGC